MVTGRLAMGVLRLLDQNWLLSAVNRSGAVSPEIRATASSMPVTIPESAAREATERMTIQRDAPKAVPALRNRFGTRLSMFSVVRTTTGTTSMASAAAPARAEK